VATISYLHRKFVATSLLLKLLTFQNPRVASNSACLRSHWSVA